MCDINTVLNGIMTAVAIMSAIGALAAWIKSCKERKAAEKSALVIEDSAKAAEIYYKMMVEKMQEDKGKDREAERDKIERVVLEFIILNGERKTSVADVSKKISMDNEETIELLTYMLKITHTIGHTGNGLNDNRAMLWVAPNGKTKLQN